MYSDNFVKLKEKESCSDAYLSNKPKTAKKFNTTQGS